MYDFQYTLEEQSPVSRGVDMNVVANYSESRLLVSFPLLDNGTDISVRILSASGKQVRTVTVAPGARETIIPLQEMSRGVYYAALYDGARLLGVRGFLF